MNERETGLNRRNAPDRRRKPTPIISRYTFWGGRRKKARREAERGKYVFVDVYSTRLLITLLLFMVLCFADALFTLTLIHGSGVQELNPVMAFFLQFGDMTFFLMKFLFTSVSVLILCLCKNIPATRVVVFSAFIIYLTVLLYEVSLLNNI